LLKWQKWPKAKLQSPASMEKRLGIVRSLLTRLVRDPRIEAAGHITIVEVVALTEEANEDTSLLNSIQSNVARLKLEGSDQKYRAGNSAHDLHSDATQDPATKSGAGMG